MIAELLPSMVACVETTEDAPEETLLPAEAARVAQAVAKRRREYATVRHCARQALAQLGLPPVPILPRQRGAPSWPDGVCGSMTHCQGYRAAAVARQEHLHALGIDAEPHGPLPDGVGDLVLRPEEHDRLAAFAAQVPGVYADRLLFSAKESVYKAWYPLAERWLGFEDASLTFRADGTFAARILIDPPEVAGVALSSFHGRWGVTEALVLTAVTVPAT